MADNVTIPGYTNALSKTFDAPGQPFNNRSLPGYRFLKQLPPSGPANPTDLVPDGTQLRRNFDDYTPFASEAAPPAVFRRQTVVGNFSAVRAARILHQHAINFWTDPDIRAVLNNPPAPVYSDDVIQKLYQDFTLFNYLPAAMTPTQAEFTAIVQPGGNFDPLIGLEPSVPPTEIVDDTPVLTSPPSFGEVLTTFCQLVNARTVRSA